MKEHAFIFTKGIWLGEGLIRFSGSSEEISFYTKWEVEEIQNGIILLNQKVEMQGIDQKTANAHIITPSDNDNFSIEISNETLDKVKGKGVCTPTIITWEFNVPDVLEGFEIFEKETDPHLYNFHAEYASTEFFKTIIDGKIWKK